MWVPNGTRKYPTRRYPVQTAEITSCRSPSPASLKSRVAMSMLIVTRLPKFAIMCVSVQISELLGRLSEACNGPMIRILIFWAILGNSASLFPSQLLAQASQTQSPIRPQEKGSSHQARLRALHDLFFLGSPLCAHGRWAPRTEVCCLLQPPERVALA